MSELILTSSAIYGHLLRCFYTLQLHKSPFNYDDFNLTPENYGLKAEEFALGPQKYQVLCQKNTQLVANIKKVALEDVTVNRLKKARAQNFVVVLGSVKLRYTLELCSFNCFLILRINWISYE